MSSLLMILAYRGKVGGSSLWLTKGSKPIIMGWSAECRENTHGKGLFTLKSGKKIHLVKKNRTSYWNEHMRLHSHQGELKLNQDMHAISLSLFTCVCVCVLPPLLVSFCDWMPCWILEWMADKRSAAWTTSFWASLTELVWYVKQHTTTNKHIAP